MNKRLVSKDELDSNYDVNFEASKNLYLNKNKTYAQSPMDNSTDNPEKVISSIKNFFKIIKIQYYDGFIDKLIGGLRGKHRFKIAKLLKEFDNYLIKENIIKGTTLYLVAKKK